MQFFTKSLSKYALHRSALEFAYPHLTFLCSGDASVWNVLVDVVGRKSALEDKRAAIAAILQKTDKLVPINKTVAAKIMLFVDKIVVAHMAGDYHIAER